MSGEQSNTTTQRPPRVPTREELPPLQPRAALAIVDEGITFLRIDPALLFGAALIVLLPIRLMSALIPGSPLRGARPDDLADIFVANIEAPGAISAAFAALVGDSIALFAVAVLFGELLSHWQRGRSVDLTTLLVSAIKRSPVVLLSWSLVHLIELVGGALTCGIGAVLAGMFLIATAPALGAERTGPWEALGRSRHLVGSKLGHVFVIYVVSGLGALVIKLCIQTVPSAIGLELLNLPLWAVSGVAEFVGAVVSTAFVAAVAVVAYTDLRVRSEGLDLYVSLQEVFD